jgi:hypothetical protein
MPLTSRLVSIPGLIKETVIVFLKSLPLLLVVYFLPAFIVMAASLPLSVDLQGVLAILPHDAGPETLARALAPLVLSPRFFAVACAVLAVAGFGNIFSCVLTDSMVGRERFGMAEIFSRSIKAVPRYIAAWLAYFGIIILFAALLPVVFMVARLPVFVNLALFVLYICGLIFTIVFMFTGIFFARVAVLRGKWPDQIFYESYKVVKTGVVRLILYLMLLFFFAGACSMALEMFSEILFGILSIFLPAAHAHSLPFVVFINGITQFLLNIGITVFYINGDYNANPDMRMEYLSRVAAGRDKSMPSI